MSSKSKYIAILTLLVLDQELKVAFKTTGFRFPPIQDGPIDIESMVANDQQIMEKLGNADSNQRPTLIGELSLPPLVEPYLGEKGQVHQNLFFDILSEEQYVEATTETSKLDLKSAIAAKDAEIASLKASNEALHGENEKLKASSVKKTSKTEKA